MPATKRRMDHVGDMVIEKDVMIPMRDGVGLAADIYHYDGEAGKNKPVMLMKGPYNKDDFSTVHGFLCSPIVSLTKGYNVVVVNDRGTWRSEGTFRGAQDAANDAYDTVEWIAAQPFCDGNVGMYGYCGMAWDGFYGAVANAPHLKAVFSYVSTTNFSDGWLYTMGGFNYWFSQFWADFLEDPYHKEEGAVDADARMEAAMQISTGGIALPLHIPAAELPEVKDNPYWKEWVAHYKPDEFWDKDCPVKNADKIKTPLLMATGWYDVGVRGYLRLNEAMKQKGDKATYENSRIIIGPWDHSAYYNGRSTYSGERDFGVSTGTAYLSKLIFSWFDQWLKGKPATILPEDNKVQYWQLGENVWKETPDWPPQHTVVPYYLHSEGRANSRLGNGVLSTETPDIEPKDSFIYDPLNPVLTKGGQTMSAPQGIQDQAETELRDDVLVYTSARLTEPLALAGPVTLTLYASSSAVDTDFTAKLVDVEPDGYCVNVTKGFVRARFRNGTDHEELLTPGKVEKYEIEFFDTAHTFLPNHAIRLEVSSSDFPDFDRNMNCAKIPVFCTEEDVTKAVQEIHHSNDYQSSLNLPVVKI